MHEGRKRLGITNRQLYLGTRLVEQKAIPTMRTNMSRSGCIELHVWHIVANIVVLCNLPSSQIFDGQALNLGALQLRTPHWLRLSELLGAFWPPQTADRFYPTISLASQKKTPAAYATLERGQCVILRLVASTNKPYSIRDY